MTACGVGLAATVSGPSLSPPAESDSEPPQAERPRARAPVARKAVVIFRFLRTTSASFRVSASPLEQGVTGWGRGGAVGQEALVSSGSVPVFPVAAGVRSRRK